MSVTLSTPDLHDPAGARAFFAVADAAAAADGYAPFNEQSLLDLTAGRREPRLISAPTGPGADRTGDAVVGAAIVGRGELDLVVRPEFRGRGYGGAALAELLRHPGVGDELTAWSHGDSPAARTLADRFGFEAVRTLLQLRLDPLPTAKDPSDLVAPPASSPAGHRLEPFRPGADDEEWVNLNARVFASHPEQGRVTSNDLAARQAEPWFDPGDFLLARDPAGRMAGYVWLKIGADTDGRVGEVYVIGVAPEAAGAGLGRALLSAGLERLRQRGCLAASLYVEADNRAALALYRSLGFTDFTIDVQYRRTNG